MRKYYTMAVREPNAKWSPQFGDFNRAVVDQEMKDTRGDWAKGSKFNIFWTDYDAGQKAIDDMIIQMNHALTGT
jgi:hypothetical protein